MDGKKKYRLEGFLPWDTASIIQHLEGMARKGWRLERAGAYFWTYRQAASAALRYAVTYFPDSQFQGAFGEPTEDQASYCDYCAAAGWQLVCCCGPQQVFVSDRAHPVPIETDEGEKLAAIHRSVKKTLLLPLAVLLPLLLVLWPAWSDSAQAASLSGMGRALSLAWAALPLAAALCMLIVAADYLVWYLRSRRSVDRGGACLPAGTRVRRILQWLPAAAYALYGLVLLWAMAAAGRVLYLLALAGGAAALAAGSWGLLRLLKKRNSQADESLVIALAVCIGLLLLAVLGSGLIPFSPF